LTLAPRPSTLNSNDHINSTPDDIATGLNLFHVGIGKQVLDLADGLKKADLVWESPEPDDAGRTLHLEFHVLPDGVAGVAGANRTSDGS
jgi:hypothetical protein